MHNNDYTQGEPGLLPTGSDISSKIFVWPQNLSCRSQEKRNRNNNGYKNTEKDLL